MAAQYTLPAWVDKLSIEDAVKLLLIGFFGQTAPSGGGSGGVVLGGVQETRTVTQNLSTVASYSIPLGWLSYSIEFSSDYVGTVNGIARTGAALSGINDYASPGNTGPAIAVTRSAGTYTITEGRRP